MAILWNDKTETEELNRLEREFGRLRAVATSRSRCNVSHPTIMILLHVLSFITFLSVASYADASALTTTIGANERLCFYADVDTAGEKIGVSPSGYP